jgi:hypothetical protein
LPAGYRCRFGLSSRHVQSSVAICGVIMAA